jgi:hypothetical protein
MRISHLEHDGGGDADSNLNNEHEEQGDNEAAHGGLTALSHAVYDDNTGQEPDNANEDEKAL